MQEKMGLTEIRKIWSILWQIFVWIFIQENVLEKNWRFPFENNEQIIPGKCTRTVHLKRLLVFCAKIGNVIIIQIYYNIIFETQHKAALVHK